MDTNKIVVVVVAFVVMIMWYFGRFKLLTIATEKVSAIHQKHKILYLLLGKLLRVWKCLRYLVLHRNLFRLKRN